MIRTALLGLTALAVCGCGLSPRDALFHVGDHVILPEQRSIDVHDPAPLPSAGVPPTPPPRTVLNTRPETVDWQLSLDEAIRIALENTQVVRVLAGTTAASSGQTVYDTAITNTTIDEAQGVFDPVLRWDNQWSRTNVPTAVLDPFDPNRARITSTPFDEHRSVFGLTQNNVLGGQAGLTWTLDPRHFPGTRGLPLNPERPSSVVLSYTQPLLQGGGFQVNTAPIVIARLNTEQSYYQFKDSVQELVRGVIEAYWGLVQARIDAWARGIQVQQFQEAFQREQARLESGLGDAATVAQARVSYNQFKSSQIAADAAVLTREDALRNLLGLVPTDGRRIVPVSAPASRRLEPNWDALVHLAEERRPDITALKLATEIDRVRLVQAENQALPRLDAVTQYRFNELSGTQPNGERLSTPGGKYTDWSVALNLSLPLGLRTERARVRQQVLQIARDQANVQQSVHAAVHQLASTVRELDSAFAQYQAFKETRVAADQNVRVQNEQFKTGRTIYLNVLVALNDWGNAVSSEALQLLNYNVALATLERQTGTILETHGLVFTEEQFRAQGPLLHPGCDRLYPAALVPTGEPHRYPGSGEPSENVFDLKNPATRDGQKPEKLPAPRPEP